MVIEKEEFRQNFKPFDKEIVVEIIDIFIQEWPDRQKEIQKNIEEGDFESLRFNAHSLKGVVANFIADEPKTLAKQLEDNAKEKIDDDNLAKFQELTKLINELIEELKEIKEEYV
ncbi:MAG: Hpt domain-containing protein [Bacteroidales bacterium]|nr:Hpt domain-containing protein [Bacteroidales bacterium]MCF8386955.1 Hpt domain-containing protein [Bacteroidales bacterium]MCF8398565.1 Hpt domain-containing protein [Bacteroidales bacterium]